VEGRKNYKFKATPVPKMKARKDLTKKGHVRRIVASYNKEDYV
jgi:hypothetical protein